MACKRKRTNQHIIHDMQPKIVRDVNGKVRRTLGLYDRGGVVKSGPVRKSGIALPRVTEGDKPSTVLDRSVRHTLRVSWSDRRERFRADHRDTAHTLLTSATLTDREHSRLMNRLARLAKNILICSARIEQYS